MPANANVCCRAHLPTSSAAAGGRAARLGWCSMGMMRACWGLMGPLSSARYTSSPTLDTRSTSTWKKAGEKAGETSTRPGRQQGRKKAGQGRNRRQQGSGRQARGQGAAAAVVALNTQPKRSRGNSGARQALAQRPRRSQAGCDPELQRCMLCRQRLVGCRPQWRGQLDAIVIRPDNKSCKLN